MLDFLASISALGVYKELVKMFDLGPAWENRFRSFERYTRLHVKFRAEGAECISTT